ncbi:thiol:disulfide interchange protein DsbG precursor [mine drainage metagenome]|uniref:Thiol:disulfide interchange protein DsbG n=1 Tax=mine drainage metagenome TaxID=410659 RepID=A0A1J5RU65_9ZZZZ
MIDRFKTLAARLALFTAPLLLAAPALSLAATYPKAIQAAVDGGVKVVKTFPAASSLTGWVLSEHGHYSLVFTTPDRKTLIAGQLIGEDNQDLTAGYAEQYIPKPDHAALMKDLIAAPHIVEGAAKNPKSVLYVFFDPNCPFCHYTWMALQAYEKVGLQVHWIPVAVLGPTSLPKALAIMAAADKTAAFRKMEVSGGMGKPAPAGFGAGTHPELSAAVQKNGELMDKFGIGGTPGIVWREKGGKVKAISGMPRLADIPAIVGLPEQKNDDPELARFR